MSSPDEIVAIEREVDANYDSFARCLGQIKDAHWGQFALMRHQEIVAFHDTRKAAYDAGVAAYSDRLFSIQEVDDRPVDLGWWSHVAG